MNKLKEYDNMGKTNNLSKLELFNYLKVKIFPPVFHKWFLNQFNSPSKWFQSRLNYSRFINN
jgi:serine/threonine-protein kinase ATR